MFMSVRGRWLVLLAALGVFAPLFISTAGSAKVSPSAGRLEVNVMNAPVRGGEPEIAIDPLNPQIMVLGHTSVGNTYANDTTADMLSATANPGGLQVSRDGGKTWSAERAIRTSGFTDPPNPFLIAHGST